MTSRLGVTIAAVVVSACAGVGPAPAASPGPGGSVGDFSGVDLSGPLLPAGDWYSGHNYATCWDCPAPAAVVVLDVYGDAASAERAVAAVPAGAVPPGYPMVLHTDELALAQPPHDGLVVVLGQFETLDQARAWRERTSTAFPQATVMPLLQGDEAWNAWDRGSGRRVVRIQSGEPAPAFSPADAEAFSASVGCRDYGGDEPCPPFPEAHPLCALPPGAIFVTTDEEIGGLYYQWLPVRCGGEPAFVAWRFTLFAATVLPRDGGGWFLRQTVGAECDVPTFEEWTYDEHGRHPPETPPPAPQMEIPPGVAGIRGAPSAGGGQGGCSS